VRLKWWQLALGVSVSIGFVVLLYVVAEFGRLRLVAAEDDVRRAQVQLARVVDLYQLVMNASSGHRGYLLSGDAHHLEALHRADGRIETLSRELAGAYEGNDESIGAAIRELGVVATQRMTQMEETIAAYQQHGPAAALKLANSPAGAQTMARFRELAGITRDYERALMARSLDRWERDLALAGRLNLATLLLGMLLTATAAAALARNQRQRVEAADDLRRQHDELKSQFDAQAAGAEPTWRGTCSTCRRRSGHASRAACTTSWAACAAGGEDGRDLDAAASRWARIVRSQESVSSA
jgi:CHASE3 domain sensor protein